MSDAKTIQIFYAWNPAAEGDEDTLPGKLHLCNEEGHLYCGSGANVGHWTMSDEPNKDRELCKSCEKRRLSGKLPRGPRERQPVTIVEAKPTRSNGKSDDWIDGFKKGMSVGCLYSGCESPIEEQFLVGFALESILYEVWSWINIETQFKVGPYRVDFAVQNIKNEEKMVVECDGHDFHERTKEQAAYDRAKDRYLQSKGYVIFRFTGSEIHRDPNACAQEVLRYLFGVAAE